MCISWSIFGYCLVPLNMLRVRQTGYAFSKIIFPQALMKYNVCLPIRLIPLAFLRQYKTNLTFFFVLS
jgi:hypothetical protein